MWCGVTGEAERTVDHTANAQYTPLIFGCCVCLWGFFNAENFSMAYQMVSYCAKLAYFSVVQTSNPIYAFSFELWP